MKRLNFTNKLRVFFLLVILLGLNYSAKAQTTYKIVENEVVKVDAGKKKIADVKTKLTHKIKGVIYPVYKSKRGAYYILRTSKKTKKQYKQYLKIKN